MADGRTRIIPGHAPVGDAAALRAFRNMLVTARDQIKPLVSAGRTLADVKKAAPLKDLDPKWGQGLVSGDSFTEICSGATGPCLRCDCGKSSEVDGSGGSRALCSLSSFSFSPPCSPAIASHSL
jgi:hypothetical protein